jgi:hypothetical protein
MAPRNHLDHSATTPLDPMAFAEPRPARRRVPTERSLNR